MKRLILVGAALLAGGCGEVERIEPEPPPPPAAEPPKGEWMQKSQGALDQKPGDHNKVPTPTTTDGGKRGDWMWKKGKLDRPDDKER